MKNKLILVITLLCIVIMLSSCNILSDLNFNDLLEEDPTSNSSSEIKIEDIKIELEKLNDVVEEEKARITATYNEYKLWEHTTDSFVNTELENVQEVGVINNHYWYLGNGTVYALDIKTGNVAWTNDDFQGASALIEKNDEYVYMSGTYGPDLYVIDFDGNSVKRMDILVENVDAYWPVEMDLFNNSIIIKFESNGSVVKINLEDYNVTVEESNKMFSMDNILSVTASSHLVEDNITHSADRVIDNDISTAWTEGVEGQGYGESITFKFDDYYIIQNILINTGYQKSTYLFNANSTPTRFKIIYSDNSFEFYDINHIREVQNIKLNEPKNTKSITFVIDDVHEGSVYEDTAISEIKVY